MSEKEFSQYYNNFIYSLRSMLIAEHNPDILLSFAKLYCGVCLVNHNDIYFDENLEKHLTEKIAPHFEKELGLCRDSKGDDVVFICSALYDSFGHSAVVDKWLRIMGPEHHHKLIITRTITEKMAAKVKSYGVSLYQCKWSGTAGIKEIILAADHAKMIILHTHSDDIDSVVATRLLKSIGITTVFYNHADHAFSCGISAADIVCEISCFGLNLSRRSNRVLGKTFFLGIPLIQVSGDSTVCKTAMPIKPSTKMVLSCGSGGKYKPDGGFDFNDFVNRLLEIRNDVQFVLVGPNGKEFWWADSILRWGDRIKFMGIIPSDDYTCLLKMADVYVDSYPICGGTAFPEALLAGVPTIGLNTPIQGYTFADELRVDTVRSLVESTCALLDKDAAAYNNIEQVRLKVASYQTETAFKMKLENLYSLDINKNNDFVDTEYCSKTNDYFYHENWLKHKRINLYTNAIRELPIGLRIRILYLIIKNTRLIGFKDLLKTLYNILKIPMWFVRR